MANYILMIIIGLITGAITSLIGASGVTVVVPILTMIFGLTVHTAIGTSLLVDVIASLTVSYSYYKNGNIELKSGMWIALGSLAGSQLGAMFASSMGEGSLGSSFSIILVLTGIAMIRKKAEGKKSLTEKLQEKLNFDTDRKKIIASLIIGVLIGIISGLFGAGGGVMILIALIVILGFTLHKGIGTSTLIMTITALSGTIGYAVRGNIDLKLGIFIGIGSIIGGYVGSRYANKINEAMLKKIVGIVFIALAFIMFLIPLISK